MRKSDTEDAECPTARKEVDESRLNFAWLTPKPNPHLSHSLSSPTPHLGALMEYLLHTSTRFGLMESVSDKAAMFSVCMEFTIYRGWALAINHQNRRITARDVGSYCHMENAMESIAE